MAVTIFEGDLTDAPADAICTSTNPRLSLMMGTGGAVRERGGFEVLRECEQIASIEALPAGSVHVTSAGALPYKGVIHCVASNETHITSAALIRACVTRAVAQANAAGWTTIAMPVFGSGHARFKFEDALGAMLDAIERAPSPPDIVIAINDPARAECARRVLRAARSAS